VPEKLLTIGEVAARTGVATSALRYYDDLGLLKPKHRTGGRRRYDPDDVATVAVIVLLRQVGFTLAEIKRLLASPARSPGAWRELATRKLEELDTQIAKAEAARQAIEHSLRCPKENILACPTFWKTVSGVVSGQTVAESHTH
jgi:MerR family redox-sensitive transcriptional activator SoxR